MISFFTKHKKVQGVITVFLTIIYLSVYLLIGVFVDGGRVKMAQTVVEDVQQIATENAMSQYNRGLYEYYGLFGITDYDVDKIASDVKAQIEESVGLKIKDDVVKTFIEDLWVGTNTAVENTHILSTERNIIDKGKDYATTIIDEINDSHKRFDPYGINVSKASVSYIDLTNVEAMRAQIRDEMRYTAPLVLGANFFDAINQFMSVGNCADAVCDVADILTAIDNKIDKQQQEYYDSLNKFSDSFHSYVKECYQPNNIKWGKEKIDEKLNNAAKTIVEVAKDIVTDPKKILNSIFGWFNNEKNNNNVATEQNQNDDDTTYTISTDMHLNSEEGGGFNDIISHIENLSRFYDKFDEGPWPDGEDYVWEEQVGTDEDGDPIYEDVYHYEEHKSDVDSFAESSKNTYKSGINNLIALLNSTIDSLSTSITKIETCMSSINNAEGQFLTGHNKCTTKKSKDIYEQYMATYLRQWNTIANQKKVLLRIKKDLNEINTILTKALSDVDSVTSSIKSESISESWDEPSNKLKSKRESEKNKFQNKMHFLMLKDGEIEGLKEIQDTADAEKLSMDVFGLINTLFQNKQMQGENVVDESANALFGKISHHEKSDNVVFNPFEDIKADFDKDNVIDKIKNIMNKAKEIIESLPKNLVDNIYDETYILSHCRDYVHTYRYTKLNEAEQNGKDIDSILNPKFIKDQSATKYLSSEQFKKLQITPAEIEYILWGKEDTRENVTIMYANIFIIRLALNYIAALTSQFSRIEADALAAATLVFAPAVKFAAPLIYALPQSIYETREIMYKCQKVNVWNGGDDLHLWSALQNIIVDTGQDAIAKCKDAANSIKESAKKSIQNAVSNAGTLTIIASIRANNPPENINNAANFLSGTNLLDPLRPDDIDNSEFPPTSTDNEKVKAGYSDYLLIYLFLRGINKESQINNLQDIIEANMSKNETGQSSFRLKNTYSQISVDTECSIKYIFMTQAFMKKAFSNANVDSYTIFPLKTKTSFAY